jgi:hypothetical protein
MDGSMDHCATTGRIEQTGRTEVGLRMKRFFGAFGVHKFGPVRPVVLHCLRGIDDLC